jgi:very-long-chain enoyl-CoA reductase
LAPGKRLSDYALEDGSVVIFKDLGPQARHFGEQCWSRQGLISVLSCWAQIGYTMVFFWEYFGPLVVYALFYFFPHICYPTYSCACSWSQVLCRPCMHGLASRICAAHNRHIPPKHPVQTMAVVYWSFHYTKRILETFLVHRHATGRSVHACMPRQRRSHRAADAGSATRRCR